MGVNFREVRLLPLLLLVMNYRTVTVIVFLSRAVLAEVKIAVSFRDRWWAAWSVSRRMKRRSHERWQSRRRLWMNQFLGVIVDLINRRSIDVPQA